MDAVEGEGEPAGDVRDADVLLRTFLSWGRDVAPDDVVGAGDDGTGRRLVDPLAAKRDVARIGLFSDLTNERWVRNRFIDEELLPQELVGPSFGRGVSDVERDRRVRDARDRDLRFGKRDRTRH